MFSRCKASDRTIVHKTLDELREWKTRCPAPAPIETDECYNKYIFGKLCIDIAYKLQHSHEKIETPEQTKILLFEMIGQLQIAKNAIIETLKTDLIKEDKELSHTTLCILIQHVSESFEAIHNGVFYNTGFDIELANRIKPINVFGNTSLEFDGNNTLIGVMIHYDDRTIDTYNILKSTATTSHRNMVNVSLKIKSARHIEEKLHTVHYQYMHNETAKLGLIENFVGITEKLINMRTSEFSDNFKEILQIFQLFNFCLFHMEVRTSLWCLNLEQIEILKRKWETIYLQKTKGTEYQNYEEYMETVFMKNTWIFVINMLSHIISGNTVFISTTFPIEQIKTVAPENIFVFPMEILPYTQVELKKTGISQIVIILEQPLSLPLVIV